MDEVKNKPAQDVILQVEHLHKSYGEKEVIKDLSFEVKKGELFGLLGKNGIGKSTTIDCIIGAKAFNSGNITIDGHDIVTDPLEAKAEFGYVSSEPNCYEEMTGIEYLDFIASVFGVAEKDFENNVNYLSARLGLDEKALGEAISGYSHGMKQKLCLIASLLHSPKLWILDEPTVGLDVMAVEELSKMMKEYSHNNGVLLTSHNIDLVARLCDKAVILNHGTIALSFDFREDPNARLSLRPAFFALYGKKEATE